MQIRTIILAAALFITGFAVGTYGNEIIAHYETPKQLPNETNQLNGTITINYTGSVTINDRTFIFKELGNNSDGYRINGQYWFNTEQIYIDTDLTPHQIEATCDHEMFHHFFPDYRHPDNVMALVNDPIYRYSDHAPIHVCDALAWEMTQWYRNQQSNK